MDSLDHVSKTKLQMLFKCEGQFTFRYPMDLIRPPRAAMSFGLSWHDGAGFDFHQKAESGRNLPAEQTVDYAITSLEARKDETDWGDETLAGNKDMLAKLLNAYVDGRAQDVQPVEGGVEMEMNVELDDGTKLNGYIDVVTADGSLDLKSTGRSWSENQGQQQLEPFLYTFDEPGTSLFTFHVGVKLKKPKVQEFKIRVTEATKAGARGLITAGATRMKELFKDPGRALPTGFGSWVCTKRHCGYHVECTKRWGLPIPD